MVSLMCPPWGQIELAKSGRAEYPQEAHGRISALGDGKVRKPQEIEGVGNDT